MCQLGGESNFTIRGAGLRHLSGIVDFGVGGSYSCTKGNGALLYLWDRGDRTLCDTNTVWERHIRGNFEAWEAYFAECGYENKPMIVVRGFVKTSAWDAFAWSQYSTSQSISASASVGGYAGAGASHGSAVASSMTPERRSFPARSNEEEFPLTAPQLGSITGSTLKARDDSRSGEQRDNYFEQTVFLSYYYIRRRWFFIRTVVANAGYHDLPPTQPDPGMGSDVHISTERQEDDEVSTLGMHCGSVLIPHLCYSVTILWTRHCYTCSGYV